MRVQVSSVHTHVWKSDSSVDMGLIGSAIRKRNLASDNGKEDSGPEIRTVMRHYQSESREFIFHMKLSRVRKYTRMSACIYCSKIISMQLLPPREL
jgi:hypothetical protein